MSKVFRMDPDDIFIPERVLAARLGFKGVGEIPEEFRATFKRAMSMAREVASPLAIYEDFQVETLENCVIVDGKVLTGKSVEENLMGSSEISLILATLGSDVDEEITRLHEIGEDLLSFFLDGIASEMVEYFVRSLDSVLREEHRSGGPRISPGYGDLPLSLNSWIIEELGGYEYGIRYYPETFFMIPRKTISAMVGWK